MQPQEIENIYSIFSKYKLTNPVIAHYCPVCLSEQDNTYFQTIPLHLLQPAYLSRYFSSAGILDGNHNDFKYFIPRILEIIYNDIDDGSFFFPQVWDRLAEANYNQWEKKEVESINSLFQTYLEKYIQFKNKEQFKLTRDILKDIGYTDADKFMYIE